MPIPCEDDKMTAAELGKLSGPSGSVIDNPDEVVTIAQILVAVARAMTVN